MRVLVKMQRPLFSNDPEINWLFYDRTRAKIWEHRKPTLEEIEAIGNELKAYGVYRYDGVTKKANFLRKASPKYEEQF